MKAVRLYIKLVDKFNYFVGRFVMFGILIMMAVLLWSTISKFSDQPSLWTLEVSQFAMVAYFFLGGPYAIQMGSHVKMDLFYENWSPKRKAATDSITVLCLIAYLTVLLWGGLHSTAYSLGYFGTDPITFFIDLAAGEKSVGIFERSRTIWRPHLWPIKTIMCFGIFLMLLQTLCELSKDILRLRGEEV